MFKFINRVRARGATLFVMQAGLPAARDYRAAAGRQLVRATHDRAAPQGLMAAPFSFRCRPVAALPLRAA